MGISVEETLKAADLPADVIPHMIWQEVLAGVSKRRVFLEPATRTNRLRGAMGTKISVPYLSTRFSASTASEAQVDAGYSVTDLAVLDTDVSIGNQVYVAFRLSDILLEDQPTYNWVQLALRDAGRAIAEYEDAAVRDVWVAGAGNTQAAGTFATLAYDDIINLLALHKTDSWHPDDLLPYLFIHPDQEADLLKDTTYKEAALERYAVGTIPELATAQARGVRETIYAGCRVRVTEQMTQTLALIVFPEHPTYGPTLIHAIKRPLTVRTDREELYGRQLWVASTRYGSAVPAGNAAGVGLITGA